MASDNKKTPTKEEQDAAIEAELRAEMVKSAEKAGVPVTGDMDAAAIETAIADAAKAPKKPQEKAPEPEPTPEPADEGLRQSLLRIARKQGAPVTDDMSVDEIETVMGDHALRDPETSDDSAEIAAPTDLNPVSEKPSGKTVSVRITKQGHGKVYTGDGNKTWPMDAMVTLPVEVAEGLEAKGYGEIR